MARHCPLLALLCTPLLAPAQADAWKNVRWARTTEGGTVIHREDHDREGRPTYALNDGNMGDVTLVLAWDYDSLGWEARIHMAHSNVGCSALQYRYKPGVRETCTYPDPEGGPWPRGDEGRRWLRALEDAADLARCPEMQALLQGTPYLSAVEQLDSLGRTVYEVRLNAQGDTTATFTTAYGPRGQERYFRYHDADDTRWRWDYIGAFNADGDRVRWSRVVNGDTTEQTRSRYDAQHHLLERTEVRRGQVSSTTTFAYDARGHRVREAYRETKADRLVVTTYRYDRYGRMRRQCVRTYRNGKQSEAHTRRTRYMERPRMR